MNQIEQFAEPNIDMPPQAHGNSWLSSLLIRRPQLLARFSTFYRQLWSLPRRQRRWVARRAAISLTGAALLLALARSPVSASTITVVNGEVADVQNGKCSLIKAIFNANAVGTGNQRTDCTLGAINGPDTINLPANGQFVLTAVHNTNYHESGLPIIKSIITINGNGATIRRDSTAPDFRILAVAPTGTLTLNATTIKGGYFDDNYTYGGIGGAGILNKGQLTINNSTVAENESHGEYGSYYGGGISNEGTPQLKVALSGIMSATDFFLPTELVEVSTMAQMLH